MKEYENLNVTGLGRSGNKSLWKFLWKQKLNVTFMFALFHGPVCSQLAAIHPVYPASFFMYRQFNFTKIPRSAHAVYLCVLCGSENKLRLFPCTVFIGWLL